ncbi:unnamed protein product [Boreogadus saida]
MNPLVTSQVGVSTQMFDGLVSEWRVRVVLAGDWNGCEGRCEEPSLSPDTQTRGGEEQQDNGLLGKWTYF